VSGALDRVTAASVRALWASPRLPCAAMDGIAVSAGSGAGPAGACATADGWRLAGSSFTWIDTGQPMPAGTDTVVEQERVRASAGGGVEIAGPVRPGQHVRCRGEDFAAGQELIPAGHRLRPSDLGAAAAAGHVTLPVARPPVAALIPTGNEVRRAGSALEPCDVVDSNSIMLAARASQAGARAVVSDVQPDDEAAIAAELRRVAQVADLVLVIAGSSAGRADHTAAVMAHAGGLAVRGVAVRPGHPVLLGHVLTGDPDQRVRAVPLIGVPGYPMAAAVIFELFAVPLLAELQGTHPAGHAARQVQLACDWTSSPEVEDWVPVSLSSIADDPDAPGPVVATPGRRGAGATSRLMSADAWWPIPIGQGKFARGDLIEIRQIPVLL
jgi:putative molybdopterin biosynthesis protein